MKLLLVCRLLIGHRKKLSGGAKVGDAIVVHLLLLVKLSVVSVEVGMGLRLGT